jgi:hypothetical protein
MADQTAEERAAALREQAAVQQEENEERYDPWRPKSGDVLEGTVIRGGKVHANDKPTKFIIVEDHLTQERVTVWCGNVVLERLVAEEAPAKGSFIVVTFIGAQPTYSDKSRVFHNYSMACDEHDFEYWQGLEQRYQAKQDAGAREFGSSPVAPTKAEVTQFGPDEAPF